MFCLHVCCVPHECSTHKGQQMAYNLWKMELQTPCHQLCGYWQPNPGPLPEQYVLLAAKLSLQSQGLQIVV